MIYIVFKAVFSTFAIIFLGFFAEKIQLLGKDSAKVLTNFVYYFALPAAIFVAMANAPISQSLNLPFIYALIISTLIIYLLGFGISFFFKPFTAPIASLRALTISSPNSVFMGIPVLLTLFGEQAMLPIAVSAVLFTLTISITIFIIEATAYKPLTLLAITKKIASPLIRNPLVIAPFAGVLYAATGLKLPALLNDFGHQLGAATGPCALFAIGQILVGNKIFASKWEFTFVGFSKLILHPALMLLLILVFHLPPLWAACGFIISALPCAVVSYIVASRYKVYEKRACALIFETTITSIVTLGIAIAIATYLWPNLIVK